VGAGAFKDFSLGKINVWKLSIIISSPRSAWVSSKIITSVMANISLCSARDVLAIGVCPAGAAPVYPRRSN